MRSQNGKVFLRERERERERETLNSELLIRIADLYLLIHDSSLFCSVYLGDGVLRTIFPGEPRTIISPISASKVARIIGMCLASLSGFKTHPKLEIKTK
jgi:hypothetical protein